MSKRDKAIIGNLPSDALDTASVQQKWDNRYARLDPDARKEPTPFVTQCLPQLPVTGRALDIAAGAGRHSLVLARHGLNVDAVDISQHGLWLARQRAIESELDSAIRFIVADVEQTWLPCVQYNVILVTFFLHRPLFPLIKQRLLPRGWLVYQTFTKENDEMVMPKPSNPDFLLASDELKDAFSDFEILLSVEDNYQNYPVARLLARKPEIITN